MKKTADFGSTVESQPWWRGAAIYQIYPRSFFDSNGDGVGDLAGVTSRLDYVAALGVDGVWLSPFYTSPMADFGYDVADYKNVDPVFGTLADFTDLIARAHELGLKIIIDQVYCHTSIAHAWFRASRENRDNEKSDWYVWADAKADGSPPNNWLSLFGGPAWSWDGRRRQYYLHHFLKDQPTLNLHNPDVVDALIDAGSFWIDLGVDGFRLDALNVGMHDQELRDNPPADDAPDAPTPYAMQDNRRTLAHPGLNAFAAKLSAAFRKSGGDDFFTVAEIVGRTPHALMKALTSGDNALSAAYNFDLIGADAISASLLQTSLSQWANNFEDGYPAWALSNHDCARVASRWRIGKDSDASARLFALLHAGLPGATFIYQGEELGLPQAEVPFEKLVDPEGIANWPASQNRDGARTPMPWRSADAYAGFTTAEPWLPVDPRHCPQAVDAQEGDASSMLSLFQQLVSLRRNTPALRYGDQEVIDAPENVLSLLREINDDSWLCVYNFSDEKIAWNYSAAKNYDAVLSVNEGPDWRSVLPPLGGVIARRRTT